MKIRFRGPRGGGRRAGGETGPVDPGAWRGPALGRRWRGPALDGLFIAVPDSLSITRPSVHLHAPLYHVIHPLLDSLMQLVKLRKTVQI